MNHTRSPLVKLITCIAMLAVGGGAAAASDPATGPSTVPVTPPESALTNAAGNWCDTQFETLVSTPFPGPSAAQIADYSSAWRTAVTTPFIADDAGPSPVTEAGTIDEAGTAAVSLLDEMDALAGEGDLAGAVVAAERVDDLAVHRLAAIAISGRDCGFLTAENAAASTLEAPLLGGWQVGSGFGSIWIARQFTNLVERLDPATGEIVASIDVGALAIKMQPADGRLWVRTADAFVAIDPATNAVDTTIRKADVGAAADRSWAVDGALWICDGSRLHRYNPATLERITTIDLEIECGQVYATEELAVAWTYNTDDGESGTSAAALIDPASNDVVHTVSLPMDATVPVVLDDVVYLAGDYNDRAATIDRATGAVTEAPSLTLPARGSQTAFDGEAIYVLAGDHDTIMVVDVDTFEVSGEIPTVGANSIEIFDGMLWTANNVGGFTQAFETIAAGALLDPGADTGTTSLEETVPA